jgi:hypothetical protein
MLLLWVLHEANVSNHVITIIVMILPVATIWTHFSFSPLLPFVYPLASFYQTTLPSPILSLPLEAVLLYYM